MKIKIIDSTLREGRQSSLFNQILNIQSDYLRVISKLGVYDVEYRNPFISEFELNTYTKLKKEFPKINFYTHIFLSKRNIDFVLGNELIDNVSTFLMHPFTPASLANLEYLLINFKKSIRVGIENIPSITDEDLNSILILLNKYDAVKRVGFCDTLGTFTSDGIELLLEKINKIGLNNKEFEFHLHNDYGLSAANAYKVMTLMQTSDNTICFSASMYGIGERNGITSYGDFFSNIFRLKIDHNYNLEVYGELINLMEQNHISFNRDPLNQNVFTYFASSHIISDISEDKYQNINPEVFGLEKEFIFNNLTGADVYNHIAVNILKKKEPKKFNDLKDFIDNKCAAANKTFLHFNEVLDLIKTFYINNYK